MATTIAEFFLRRWASEKHSREQKSEMRRKGSSGEVDR